MTKEDLDFLKELQHELLTQEHDCQAAPRFWGICETKECVTKDGCGDISYIVDMTGGEGQKFTLEDYVKDLETEIEENFTPDGELAFEWKQVVKTDEDEVISFAENWLDRRVGVCDFERKNYLSDQTGCFLTKRAAKKHIELNGYHYQNPHTYAMTAWRNPEFEKFLKIFENLDLTKLETLVSDDDAEQQQDTGSR